MQTPCLSVSLSYSQCLKQELAQSRCSRNTGLNEQEERAAPSHWPSGVCALGKLGGAAAPSCLRPCLWVDCWVRAGDLDPRSRADPSWSDLRVCIPPGAGRSRGWESHTEMPSVAEAGAGPVRVQRTGLWAVGLSHGGTAPAEVSCLRASETFITAKRRSN